MRFFWMTAAILLAAGAVFADMGEAAGTPSKGALRLARRRLFDKLEAPILEYWRELESSVPDGRYAREYRLKEMEQELDENPAYLPLERAFKDETRRDERVFQARDVMFEKPGELREQLEPILEDEKIRREKSPSPLPFDPREKLQERLGRRVLNFWLLKRETRREELIKYQDLRENLYDLGQDETPEEFQERRVLEKEKFLRFEPLKRYRTRLIRQLMDARAKNLMREWRDRSPAFSRTR